MSTTVSGNAPLVGAPRAGKRALLLLNQDARQVDEHGLDVTARLRDSGFTVVQPALSDRASVATAIRENASTTDLVIAGGGDGTLNAVLQALVGTGLPLGIIPLGTANDLAKTLGLPSDPKAACDVIAHGELRRIDAGCVNGTYFFNETSIGMSPTVSRALSKDAKAALGVFAILEKAIRIMARMRRFTALVRCDGEEHVLRTAQLTVGNSKNFGGFVGSDDAEIDDRRLDLYSVAFRHWWSYFEVLVSLIRRRYDDAGSVFTLHGRMFEVSTHKPKAIEADGEIVSMTPARIWIVPRAVSVFVPPTERRTA